MTLFVRCNFINLIPVEYREERGVRVVRCESLMLSFVSLL